MRRGEVTPPYGSITGGAQQRADVPKAWLPPLRPAGDEGRHAGSSCPTGGCGEPPRSPWVAAHSGASAARSRGVGRNRSRDHPQSVQQRRAIPQSWLRRASSCCGTQNSLFAKRSQNFDHCHSFLLASSATGGARKRPPLHKGALGTRDADCRVASLLAMTVLILRHSEEAQRADVGIRPFYDGRGFGPPYLGHGLRRPNFVPKFGASVRSSAPTEGLPKPWASAPTGAAQAVLSNAGWWSSTL